MLFLFDPVPQATAHPSLSAVLDIVDKVVKVAAVLIAAAWGYLNYRRGRTFKRRLEPRISGKVIFSNGTWLLCGEAELKNVGLSVVTIEQKGTAIVVDDLLVAKDSVGASRVASERVAVLEVFKAHGWIEPGESIKQSFLNTLPSRADRVAARLRLRVVSHSTEWNDDSVAEIVQPPKPEPPKTDDTTEPKGQAK